MLTLNALDREFEPRLGQTKDYKLVYMYVASPLSTQH
jgi:hypothetical protein